MSSFTQNGISVSKVYLTRSNPATISVNPPDLHYKLDSMEDMLEAGDIFKDIGI